MLHKQQQHLNVFSWKELNCNKSCVFQYNSLARLVKHSQFQMTWVCVFRNKAKPVMMTTVVSGQEK